MNRPQTREEWIALAAKYHRLLGELAHHVEHGRIVGTPRRGEWKASVDMFLECCFKEAEDSPFAPDLDMEEILRDETAETLAAIQRAGGQP